MKKKHMVTIRKLTIAESEEQQKQKCKQSLKTMYELEGENTII